MYDTLDIGIFAALEPISSIGPARMLELLEYCRLQHVDRGQDPFSGRTLEGQSIYLIQGELEIIFEDDNRVVMRAHSEWARHPIGKRQPNIRSANALTDIQLLHVEDSLLDKMVTWDQVSLHDDIHPSSAKEGSESPVRRLLNSGMLSVENLSRGPLAHLPSANISKLLNRIEPVVVWDKEVIIRTGDEGDYYYMLESGRAQVTRLVGGVSLVLAELKAGDVFGEEALISDSRRNATVTMKSNGVLLRLKKQDFQELMQEPLLRRIGYQEAKQMVSQGTVWMDVRNPAEYRHDKLADAINIPLSDIRNAVGLLNKSVPYISYCQSGQRSAAAAFILAQAGFSVYVLENGLWSVPKVQQQ